MAEPSFHPDHIAAEEFREIVASYGKHIEEVSKASKAKTTSLAELDEYLFGDLQADLRARAKRGDPYFALGEVEKCIEWKLKHGKFRPNLLNLARSNTPEDVKEMSSIALKKLPTNSKPTATSIMQSLGDISKLRGIGPASASLLLSIACPEYIPFFSDEAYRWVTTSDSTKGDPWKRSIKYNKQEYLAYLAAVDKVAGRLNATASEVERVGWVLGRKSADISAPGNDGEDSE